MQQIKSTIDSRSLSKLICNSSFKNFILDDDISNYAARLKKVLKKGGYNPEKGTTVRQLLDYSYSYLLENYRHEYIYKTNLLTKFILNEFDIKNSVILNEFKIGKSKADVVVVNGKNIVFEIKTELDSPDRLKTQIDDYYKIFSQVYIVTHHTLSSKYLSLIPESVGLISFECGKLTTIKPAMNFTSQLNTEVMFRSLRKAEFTSIIQGLTGSVPDIPPTLLFKECLNIAKCYDSSLIQAYYLNTIKQRCLNKYLFDNTNIPEYFKYVCYISNLKEKHFIDLTIKLNKKVN